LTPDRFYLFLHTQLNSQHENVFTMSRAQQWASLTFPAIYSLLPSHGTLCWCRTPQQATGTRNNNNNNSQSKGSETYTPLQLTNAGTSHYVRSYTYICKLGFTCTLP